MPGNRERGRIPGGRAEAGRPVVPGRARLSLAVLLVLPSAAVFGWTASPSLRGSVQYNDNILLTRPDRGPVDDWILEVAPGLAFSHRSRRSRFDLDYRLQLLRYLGNAGYGGSFNSLESRAELESPASGFYLRGQASIRQRTIDPNRPIAADNRSATDNRTDVFSLTVAPGFKGRLAGRVDVDLGFVHSRSEYGRGRIDSAADRVGLVLSGPVARRLRWRWDSHRQAYRYANEEGGETLQSRIDLTYRLAGPLEVTAAMGYDEVSSRSALDANTASGLWSLGLKWRPSAASEWSATVGERFFGGTYAVTWEGRSGHVRWHAGYDESYATDAAATGRDVLGELATFRTNFYLGRRGSVSIEWRGARLSIGLSGDREVRRFGDPIGSERVGRWRFSSTYALSRRSSLAFFDEWTVRHALGFATADRFVSGGLTWSHDLWRDATLRLTVRRDVRDSGPGIDGYQNDVVSVEIRIAGAGPGRGRR